jgi:hypothetical protein
MTETPDRGDDRIDDRRTDEDRDVSGVGLPSPGSNARTDVAADALGERDVDVDGGPVSEDPISEDAALDEVFPPDGSG